MFMSADFYFNFGADRLPDNILRSLPRPRGNDLFLLFFLLLFLGLPSAGEVLHHFLIAPHILLDNFDESLLEQRIVLLHPLGQLEDLADLGCQFFVALISEQLHHHVIDLFDKGSWLHHC